MQNKFQNILLLIIVNLALCKAQNYTSYFTGNTTDIITNPLGGICLMGGSTENDNAMVWFLERANGGDVLVLRASGSDGYNNYMYSQLGVSLNSVETIVFNAASASNETYIHDRIQKAEAIWFAGGDQWNYVSYWRNTSIASLINDAILNRNIAIGGTSAGMAIQGAYYFSAENGTVTSANILANPYTTNATVDHAPFLTNSILSDVITDTHYDNPDRKGRHTAFLARLITDHGVIAKGIACDEYTAICIDNNGLAKVFGEYPTYDDNAYFIQPNCQLMSMQPENCSSGNPLNWNHNGEALKVYTVKGTLNGTNTFNLTDWETGNGGTWEHWYVNNGTFMAQSGTAANCSALLVENFDDATFTMQPNPAENEVELSYNNPLLNPATITVYNTLGKQQTAVYSAETTPFILNVANLESGVYFVKVTSNNLKETYIKKLIVK